MYQMILSEEVANLKMATHHLEDLARSVDVEEIELRDLRSKLRTSCINELKQTIARLEAADVEIARAVRS